MRSGPVVLAVLLAIGPARADPLAALRLEDLSVTRERPLFRPSRRPPSLAPIALPAPAPAPVEASPVALEPPPFDLVGSAVGNHDAIVLLRSRTKGEIVRLRKGEEAEGWRAMTIGLRSVTLEREGREESLALTSPSASPAAAQIAGESQPAESANAPQADDFRPINGRGRPDH